MAWVVYQSSDQLAISGHPTQAAANKAAAILGAGFIAHRVNDAGGNEARLPVGFEPSNVYVASDGQIEYDPVVTTAQKLTVWQNEIGQRARYFDLGLKRHWVDERTVWTTAGVVATIRGYTPDERWINTMDWGRGWCGWLWKRILEAEAGTPTAMELTAIETSIGHLAAEIPNPEHVEVWYHFHDPSTWASYRHQVWRTSATGFGAGRVDTGTHDDDEWYTDFIARYESALRNNLGF